ncbi:hypothetical protein V6N13_082544 [Hibiscus sabdariffa]
MIADFQENSNSPSTLGSIADWMTSRWTPTIHMESLRLPCLLTLVCLHQASANSTGPHVATQPEQPKPYESSSFGSWMVVERKQRRGPKKQVDVAVNSSIPHVVTSRFSPISEDVAIEQPAPTDLFTRSLDTHAAAEGKTIVSTTTKAMKPKLATVIRKPFSVVQGHSRLRFHYNASSYVSYPTPAHKSLDLVNHSVVSMFENDNPKFLISPIHPRPTKSTMHSASMEQDKEHQVLPPDKRGGGMPSSEPNLFSCDNAPLLEQGFGEIPSDHPSMVVDLEVTPNADAMV